ncbi:MAG: hypothetical protein VZQ80_09570 [Lachnospiraceae bacterium]|nr:hypothetical protein [Lachnospiraceae bacterium]
MIGESIQKFIDAQMNNGIKTKIGDLIAIRNSRNSLESKVQTAEINSVKAATVDPELRKRRIEKAITVGCGLALFTLFIMSPELVAFADTNPPAQSGASSTITSGFNNLLDIVKSLVSSIGTIVLLWGFFEWGTSMQSQDGVMQSSAFKRIGGGLVMVLAPQLITVFVP